MADSVFLIDADPELLRALGDHLGRIGYEVTQAATRDGALEAFERVRPDVVILDLHLRNAGGPDLLEELRARGGSVILLAGPGDTETAVRAMQVGAEHFLTKPVDLNHLAAATARVCDKARLARENALLREALDRHRRHQPQALAEVERVHIEKTLRFHGGNRTRAAQELGISRATLINKIRVYGLNV